MDTLNITNKPVNIEHEKIKKQPAATKIQTKEIPSDLAASPDGEVWKAMVGINDSNVMKNANKLINKFALSGKLGIHDIANLKNSIKQGNTQAENIAMLLTLVNEKTVNARTLRYVCKNGIMSDEMEKMSE